VFSVSFSWVRYGWSCWKTHGKCPSLPLGFLYDLPSLQWLPHSAPSATSAPQTDAIAPCGTPVSNAVPDNSSELLLLNLQIEKQQLEIHLLGLKVEAKAQSLVPTCPSKQFTISSLDTV